MSLADDATYFPLEGHYAKPITSFTYCQSEAKARAKDVINLLTSIRINNVEMEAIRQLNK